MRLFALIASSVVGRVLTLGLPPKRSSTSDLSGNWPAEPHVVSKGKAEGRRLDTPLFMHSSGCAGSTAVINVARELLELHGIVTYIHNGDMPQEVIVDKKNPFYTPKIGIGKAMKLMAEDAKKDGTTLVFKDGGVTVETMDAVSPALVELGTRTVFMERVNYLDYVTCMIRDCFGELDDIGVPVDSSGKTDSMCFDRRTSNEKTKVLYNTTALSARLHSMVKTFNQPGYGTAVLEARGFKDVALVKMEALLAYEFDDSTHALQRSLDEWSIFLRAWGIEPRESAMTNYLKPLQGSRDLEAVADKVYNYGEVKKMIHNDNTLSWMIPW